MVESFAAIDATESPSVGRFSVGRRFILDVHPGRASPVQGEASRNFSLSDAADERPERATFRAETTER